MIRLVVFDFDGVLVESVDIKTRAYALLFEEEGKDVVRQIIDHHIKHGGISRYEKIKLFYKDILQRPISEELLRTLCVRFSQLVIDAVVAAPWVEGAKNFLIRNKKNYTFIVVSGTPEDELEEIIQRREMDCFFDSVRGSPKDKISHLNEIMYEYHFKPEEIMFVGDAETDWFAAQATGVSFIWRCSLNEVLMPGYDGPKIYSLKDLESNF